MRILDVCRFSTLSEYHVSTCSPGLQKVLRKAIRCAPSWLDFAVVCGHRNQLDQEEAFRKGRSQKHWPNGKHNSLPSKAADIRPASPFSQEDWKDVARFARIMGFIEAVALEEWVPVRLGLDWSRDGRSIDEHFLDLGHIEEYERAS